MTAVVSGPQGEEGEKRKKKRMRWWILLIMTSELRDMDRAGKANAMRLCRLREGPLEPL